MEVVKKAKMETMLDTNLIHKAVFLVKNLEKLS